MMGLFWLVATVSIAAMQQDDRTLDVEGDVWMTGVAANRFVRVMPEAVRRNYRKM